ncbi:tetratricopeptide repeat (TPR)-like superfamily protein [Artemisia annua]|uniref:Tetratricopeptide repeat (TPR)-like superfamily protein n=1 Tax=Artemisia annua TaxID=35608 RepID=A0A2U1LHR4_ARTAN|nr:tetratricopeptide repeat (TPR)-like superfamily protein [Artemisia annua]
MQVLHKLDIEIGVKELNTITECCIEDAKKLQHYPDDALLRIQRVYSVFEAFRMQGFEIGEETYGPFLMFLIDMEMVEEFHYICLNIKRDNPQSLSRLAYYEMLLWIKVGDEDKIQQLIANADGSDGSTFNESFLVALCKGDRQEEVLMLLETIDIQKLSSKADMEMIFKSLGRFLLESHAKKFILELKDIGFSHQRLLELICIYAMSIPNVLTETGPLGLNCPHKACPKPDGTKKTTGFFKLVSGLAGQGLTHF